MGPVPPPPPPPQATSAASVPAASTRITMLDMEPLMPPAASTGAQSRHPPQVAPTHPRKCHGSADDLAAARVRPTPVGKRDRPRRCTSVEDRQCLAGPRLATEP